MSKVGGFLTYLQGLALRKRLGFAFVSYSWGRDGPERIKEMLREEAKNQ